jgi:hypothetical protein
MPAARSWKLKSLSSGDDGDNYASVRRALIIILAILFEKLCCSQDPMRGVKLLGALHAMQLEIKSPGHARTELQPCLRCLIEDFGAAVSQASLPKFMITGPQQTVRDYGQAW